MTKLAHALEHLVASAPRISPSNSEPFYVPKEEVEEQDILAGRRSAHTDHQGTRDFLQKIQGYASLYDSYGSSHKDKTELTKWIVNKETTGRFIKYTNDRRFRLMTFKEARGKTSQAFRDEIQRQQKKLAANLEDDQSEDYDPEPDIEDFLREYIEDSDIIISIDPTPWDPNQHAETELGQDFMDFLLAVDDWDLLY